MTRIVTSVHRPKRTKMHRAERAAEADARVKAFLARMIRPPGPVGGCLKRELDNKARVKIDRMPRAMV